LGESLEPAKLLLKQKNQITYMLTELLAKKSLKHMEKITDKLYYFTVRNALAYKKDIFRLLECASNLERFCDILENSFKEEFSQEELTALRSDIDVAYAIFAGHRDKDALNSLFDKYYLFKRKFLGKYKLGKCREAMKYDKLTKLYKLLCGIALY
jgi:hypothetical protein